MSLDTLASADQPGWRDELLADCLDAVAASPEFAAELRDILDGRERLARLAPPIPRPGETVDTLRLRSGTFGKYELRAVLGRGGSSDVYRAWEPETGRLFALKVIRSGRLASSAEVQRFRAESHIAANLSHANIVPICEVGEQDGQPYFIMPLVEGGSLAARIAEGPLSSRKAARLLAKVTRAVQYAHEQGVIHRDLKPGNILLDAEGEPHVTDFGLAKVLADSGLAAVLGGDHQPTGTGQILGTVGYMATEQARGRAKDAGPATDVYGLGAVLYAMLTGRPPFQAETVLDTVRQVIDNPPAPPQLLNPKIDTDVQTICLKCLSKSPADRYSSAQELADELDRYLARKTIRARRPNLWRYVSDALNSVNIGKQDRHTWSNICLGSALAILAMHSSLFFLLRAGASLAALWLTAALWWVPIFAIFGFFLMRGRRTLRPSDRPAVVMWTGYALASLMLLPLTRPLEELGPASGLLAWYPPLAVLTGIPFLIDASLHWGRSYLVGLGFLVLAVPLWLLPDWSPVIFGLFLAACLTYIGLAYRRSAG